MRTRSNGSPSHFFFSEIAGLETSSGPGLPKYGAPCHPDVIVRSSFANKEIHEDCFFIASFLVSRSHETFFQESRWFWGEAIVESQSEFSQFEELYVCLLRQTLILSKVESAPRGIDSYGLVVKYM